MGHRDQELATDTLCDATYSRTFSSALRESASIAPTIIVAPFATITLNASP
jgi:hypothetical protein